jgi:hypothetical protein
VQIFLWFLGVALCIVPIVLEPPSYRQWSHFPYTEFRTVRCPTR